VDNQHRCILLGGGQSFAPIQRVTHEANEGLQCDFFNDGLEVHHKGFSGTDDALVIENYHLKTILRKYCCPESYKTSK
jgi:hypothetical protein